MYEIPGLPVECNSARVEDQMVDSYPSRVRVVRFGSYSLLEPIVL